MNKEWSMLEGFTEQEAKVEALRCLSCKNPHCEQGCPTHMRIRDFIQEIKKDNLEGAYDIINSCSDLPYICSVVCPHENQCIGHCVLGIKGKPIHCGNLERYVVENVNKPIVKEIKSNKKVAIIGAGPAGISCAKELLKAGCSVEIFEATSYFGGVLAYGIPSYRLNYSRVKRIEEELVSLGAVIHYNKQLKESEIIELKKDFDAVFISIGLTKSKKLHIPKEEIKGVYDALEYLKTVNLDTKFGVGSRLKLSGTVIVIGAGNVAMDAARCAVRDGAKVLVVYRRSRLEAPATKHEIKEAEAEGVIFQFLNAPVEVMGKSKVIGLKVEEMALGEPDASGRRKPVGTGRFCEISCDAIISAIGQDPEDIYDVGRLETDYKYLVCNDLETNIKGIYAGGDIVLGAKTVVEAMVCGRKAAQKILQK
ncbi:MAG: NAD(P)-dependent oxidoreductase [Roseburia sp.]|nr:NAD(P)-dependent oxidoreductase [Anaeroplasma bactoclasticum]MCM1196165.1 NAD(P)-dependent oxidoreductase [Roseburia sp.]MCM1556994.1 NAD(P)-dependent oxidoreductase [Anaeroplasma bactoclasticum]